MQSDTQRDFHQADATGFPYEESNNKKLDQPTTQEPDDDQYLWGV